MLWRRLFLFVHIAYYTKIDVDSIDDSYIGNSAYSVHYTYSKPILLNAGLIKS